MDRWGGRGGARWVGGFFFFSEVINMNVHVGVIMRNIRRKEVNLYNRKLFFLSLSLSLSLFTGFQFDFALLVG